MVSQHRLMFGGNRSSGRVNIRYLNYPVTSQDHMIEESRDFVGGNSSLYATTQLSMVANDNAVVEMFLICQAISPNHVIIWLCDFMESIRVRHHPAKFHGYWHYGSVGTKLLVCHVTHKITSSKGIIWLYG